MRTTTGTVGATTPRAVGGAGTAVVSGAAAISSGTVRRSGVAAVIAVTAVASVAAIATIGRAAAVSWGAVAARAVATVGAAGIVSGAGVSMWRRLHWPTGARHAVEAAARRSVRTHRGRRVARAHGGRRPRNVAPETFSIDTALRRHAGIRAAEALWWPRYITAPSGRRRHGSISETHGITGSARHGRSRVARH